MERWAESHPDAGYTGTLGKAEGGPQSTPHFWGGLCTVTVPNETPDHVGALY